MVLFFRGNTPRGNLHGGKVFIDEIHCYRIPIFGEIQYNVYDEVQSVTEE